MSHWAESGTGVAGIDPGRVAEVLVRLGSQPAQGRRGSGYRVSSLMVLTAAHVVADAVEVRVRCDADRPEEWVAEATVAWADATIDVAVLTIAANAGAGAGGTGGLEPVGFGRVGERDAVLACSLMGFPRFKLRNDPARPGSGGDAGRLTQYRDSAHAVGTIAVLSNRREGTLEVSVPSPERDPDPQTSPWEGMSGAAVWSGGRGRLCRPGP